MAKNSYVHRNKKRHVLTEKEIEELPVITQNEFDNVVDMLYREPNPDYRHIPNIIRLPPIRQALADTLGIINSNFFLKATVAHIRPQRKSQYGQSLRIDEMKGLLEFMRTVDNAYKDMAKNNFFFVGIDSENKKKANKVVFNKDEQGNYIVTISKVDMVNILEKGIVEVRAGVAPAIWSPRKESSPLTRFAPSMASTLNRTDPTN